MNPDGDENQNNPNSAPNVDPMQQAIFTPTSPSQSPTSEQQNQQVITGSVVEPAASVTPTGLSHQYYSNHPIKTSASGSGDIIVGNTKPQNKNKKIWIIGGMLLGLVILASIIFAITLSRGSKTSNNIQKSFNKFANTLLYNKNNDASDIFDGYKYGDLYFLSTLESETDIKTYFDRAKTEYEDFLEQYETYVEANADNEILQDNLQYFSAYYEDLDLFSYIELRPIIGPDDFMNAFLDNPDLISTRIEEYFAIFAESKVEATRNYAGEYKNMLTQLLVAFNTYQSLGCLENRSVLVGCLSDTTNQQLSTPNATYASFQNFYYKQIARFKDLNINVYRDIWLINEELNNL